MSFTKTIQKPMGDVTETTSIFYTIYAVDAFYNNNDPHMQEMVNNVQHTYSILFSSRLCAHVKLIFPSIYLLSFLKTNLYSRVYFCPFFLLGASCLWLSPAFIASGGRKHFSTATKDDSTSRALQPPWARCICLLWSTELSANICFALETTFDLQMKTCCQMNEEKDHYKHRK